MSETEEREKKPPENWKNLVNLWEPDHSLNSSSIKNQTRIVYCPMGCEKCNQVHSDETMVER